MAEGGGRERPGSNRAELATLLRLAGRKPVAGLVAIELATAVLPLTVVLVVGRLVGRVVAGGAVAGPLAVLAGLLLVQQVLGPLRGAVSYRIERRIDGALRSRVMEAANRSPGIAPLEDPDVLDQLFLAGGEIDAFWDASPGPAAVAYLGLGARYLQAAGAAVLLAQASVPAAVGLVVTVLLVRRRYRGSMAEWSAARRAIQVQGRAARYTASLANAPVAAKDMRLFGLLGWLLDRHRAQWTGLVETLWASRRRLVLRLVVLVAVLSPVAVALFVTLVRTDLSPRELAVALQSALLVAGLFEIRYEEFFVDFGLESYHALLDVEDRLQPPRRPGDAATAVDTAGLPQRAMRFEGVDFAYPGSGHRVFDGLDLVIPAGSSLAIVGVNGAGKTTLVKLLAGLYEPAAGRITIDGHDLAAIDPDAWRERLAVIFQDFVHYDLAAADNVGFGGLSLANDEGALVAAATRAGALDVIEGLPSGWGTTLSRQYRGGTDLSGGQWQRVALARALYAVEAGAGVLVLDEPTANLDVRAEADLFDRFLELTAGLTTILVSHRFSTVRRAQRVAVLDRGRVVEEGTHEDLLAAGGPYASMFNLQAARFDG